MKIKYTIICSGLTSESYGPLSTVNYLIMYIVIPQSSLAIETRIVDRWGKRGTTIRTDRISVITQVTSHLSSGVGVGVKRVK